MGVTRLKLIWREALWRWKIIRLFVSVIWRSWGQSYTEGSRLIDLNFRKISLVEALEFAMNAADIPRCHRYIWNWASSLGGQGSSLARYSFLLTLEVLCLYLRQVFIILVGRILLGPFRRCPGTFFSYDLADLHRRRYNFADGCTCVGFLSTDKTLLYEWVQLLFMCNLIGPSFLLG